MVVRTPGTLSPAGLDATLALDVSGSRQTFRLLHPTRIGRSTQCHIRLGGSPIHAEHATLLRRGSAWMLEVAPLAPPVEVNNVAVRSAMLRSGDIISIGGVQMEFRSAGSERTTPPPATLPASAPKDPVDPRRAWITDLAARQSAIDIARAELHAERDEWLIRLAAEKKWIDEKNRTSLKQISSAEEKLKQARALALVENRQARLELDTQRDELQTLKNALAQERANLDAKRAEQERLWNEMTAEHQRQLAQAKGTRSASVRMLQQLEKDRTELNRRIEQVEAAESRLTQMQCRIERQVEIGSHELAGLQRRIDNERILLADLQRRRWMAEKGPSLARQLQDADVSPSDVANLEDLAAQLEAAVKHVEASSHEIVAADQRIREQEIRLQHLARHLALEEQRLRDAKPDQFEQRKQELEKLEREIQIQRAELDRRADELLAEKSHWAVQQSAWQQSQASERTILDHQRDRMRHQRWRLAMAQRQRRARLRRSHELIKKDQERLLVRIAQMTRQEAQLEILKQEIGYARLAQLEQTADRLRRSDPLGQDAIDAEDRALNHRRSCEATWARYEARLQRTIEWVETQLVGERQLSRQTNRGEESSEKWRVENASLAASQLEQQRIWQAEKKKYQEELARLREELESMAAHLIAPRASSAA